MLRFVRRKSQQLAAIRSSAISLHLPWACNGTETDDVVVRDIVYGSNLDPCAAVLRLVSFAVLRFGQVDQLKFAGFYQPFQGAPLFVVETVEQVPRDFPVVQL